MFRLLASVISLAGFVTGQFNCYGNMSALTPTGASLDTSFEEDGLTYSGVPASQTMVANDVEELERRKHCYTRAGEEYCISPALVAALGSRVSRGGRNLYDTDGWGSCNPVCRAYGILQCHLQNSGLGQGCEVYPWDSCEHIAMVTDQVLIPRIMGVRQKFPDWTIEMQVQGGIAAYNKGVDNVESWENVDAGTTNNDFSNDVIARMQALIDIHGWQ